MALERMGTADLELLPVVSRANMNKLEGVITLWDLLDSFDVGPSQARTQLLDVTHPKLLNGQDRF